jgi:hypothetical protein
MSLSDRVTQLYPQALGSLFAAIYGSQGYGGGILTRLRTGSSVFIRKPLRIMRILEFKDFYEVWIEHDKYIDFYIFTTDALSTMSHCIISYLPC